MKNPLAVTKIAITGGPSGGKTTLIETIKKDMHPTLAVVPEAASILFRGGFPRKVNQQGKVFSQRAIYFTQKELEQMIVQESGKNFVVCDRGALDGIAYWPFSEEDFFSNLNTNRQFEISRYQWVIHLDTAPAEQYDESNPIRVETFVEAQIINKKIKDAWRDHPQRIIISESDNFFEKMTIAITTIRSIFEGCSYEEIIEQLAN